MVNINALINALPISQLEPNSVARIVINTDSSASEVIVLIEPPAGQRVPYIDPIKAMKVLLQHQRVSPEDVEMCLVEAMLKMKQSIAEDHWVIFLDDLEPDAPECVPMPDFIAWLRKEDFIFTDIVDYLEKVTTVSIQNTQFIGYNEKWTLETLPVLPPPKAIIEFLPGPTWDYGDPDYWEDNVLHPFAQWREYIRPITQQLEKVLGESVYNFKDIGDDLDDDYVHRFLVLHWCCSYKPESAYVRYLIKISGAKDVDELKAALIDPENYTKIPFEMSCWFGDCLETFLVLFNYQPTSLPKTVAMVFMTEQAKEGAASLIAREIDKHVVLVAPKLLISDEWIQQATHYCHSWTMIYVNDFKLKNPLEILASVDELYVVANEKSDNKSMGLKLSEAAEDLLWLGIKLGIQVHYYGINYYSLYNPEDCFKNSEAPKRIAEQLAQSATFTQQLREIRLYNDYGSSGLWDDTGRNLAYDQLDLPFELLRRIAAWQRDFDVNMTPPNEGSDDWRAQHNAEGVKIGIELQATLGTAVKVKLYHQQRWMDVAEVM